MTARLGRHQINAPYWSVTVSVDGENILTIEPNMLSGKSPLSDVDEELVRTAAEHLLSFLGIPTHTLHSPNVGDAFDIEKVRKKS